MTAYPHLLEPGCPWVPLREWSGLPNVKWCEETLCSTIAEPANTWSNLAYLVVAVVCWALSRRGLQRGWALATFGVGVSSFAYHATVAFVTQVFDFVGMYGFFTLALVINLARVKVFVRAAWLGYWFVGLTALTVALGKLGLPVQVIVGLFIVAILVTEVRTPKGATYAWLFAALALLAVATTFSVADVSRRWCDPSDHLVQGHAIWHVLSACSMMCTFFFYRQFQTHRGSEAHWPPAAT